jgi:hypothetical protein
VFKLWAEEENSGKHKCNEGSEDGIYILSSIIFATSREQLETRIYTSEKQRLFEQPTCFLLLSSMFIWAQE